MQLSLSGSATAIAVFVSTNIDDIVLLAAFFGDRTLRRRAIVAGQFLGIGMLTAASAAAAYAALVIPAQWTALLGAIPLALGLGQLWRLWRTRNRAPHEAEADAVAAERGAQARLHSQVLGIAAVTVANGGDNLGVYIPIFANDIGAVPAFAATFVVMTAAWCALGYALVKNPVGGALIQRFGHIILPMVLIALGMQILWGARALLI